MSRIHGQKLFTAINSYISMRVRIKQTKPISIGKKTGNSVLKNLYRCSSEAKTIRQRERKGPSVVYAFPTKTWSKTCHRYNKIAHKCCVYMRACDVVICAIFTDNKRPNTNSHCRLVAMPCDAHDSLFIAAYGHVLRHWVQKMQTQNDDKTLWIGFLCEQVRELAQWSNYIVFYNLYNLWTIIMAELIYCPKCSVNLRVISPSHSPFDSSRKAIVKAYLITAWCITSKL